MKFSQKINILLVEDSPSDATFILHALGKSSLPEMVQHVVTGEDALAVLAGRGELNGAARPGLILLDLKLPGLDGFDVLKEVKAHDDWKSIPVIIVTSSALEDDIHRAMHLEADLYLSKPFDLDGYTELVDEIENYWENSSA